MLNSEFNVSFRTHQQWWLLTETDITATKMANRGAMYEVLFVDIDQVHCSSRCAEPNIGQFELPIYFISACGNELFERRMGCAESG